MMLCDGGNDCGGPAVSKRWLDETTKGGVQIAVMATINGATKMDAGSKPVDRPDQETVEVRQGTGPRATVSVLMLSLVLAGIAGVALLGYFVGVY